MLDLRKIRENPDSFRTRLAQRHSGAEEAVTELLGLDERRRKFLQEGEALKGERNRASKEIGAARARGEDIAERSAQVKKIGDQISTIDADLAGIETRQTDLLLRTPNVPHESVPVGQTAEQNRVERVVGTLPAFAFQPKPHWEIGAKLGLIDLEAGAKISGSGFIVFRGAGARLERALINYLLDLHTLQHGYTEISPPFLVREECMVGTSQLPKFAEDMYRVGDETPLFLVPTAEVPVTNLHREEILAAERLPIRYAAYTPCFRREAGSAGKDTRGMIRVHQFDKVELVHIVRPEDSLRHAGDAGRPRRARAQGPRPALPRRLALHGRSRLRRGQVL